MRKGNKLTAAGVRAASVPGLYGDGHGLYLQVSSFGTKAWIFRYMVDGQARKMGLGPLHTVSLAEARKRAAEARLKLQDGIDPIAERDSARDARKAAAAEAKAAVARRKTFKECADAYIADNEVGWRNAKHAAQWNATFNETKRGQTRYPAITVPINDLPVSEIDTALVLKVLKPIWREKPETAKRVRGRIEQVLAAAKVEGYRTGENPARWRGHLDKLLPQPAKLAPVQHHKAIPYVELPAFMAELRGRPGISARALEFTILNVARTSEAIGAKWEEFDLREKVWTIPATRMKAGDEHRVPLSDRATRILASLPRDAEFVFPGGRKGKPLSNMAMLELMREMRGKGATVHGLRSTFRDWAGDRTNYPREVAEAALAHAVGDKTERAYRRGDALERRRRLMADWAAYCERAPAEADNVVSISEAANG
jgi:integrase